MNSIELFVFNYLATPSFIFSFFTICGLILVPAICKSYLLWKKTDKQKDFMGGLVQTVLAILMLMNGYPIFISGILKLSATPLLSSGILRFLFSGLPIAAFAFFSSKAYVFAHKTKRHKSIANLSWMTLSIIAALYCISIYFIVFLHQAILFTTS